MNDVKKKLLPPDLPVNGKLSKKEKSIYKLNEKYLFRKTVMFLTELLIVHIGFSFSLA